MTLLFFDVHLETKELQALKLKLQFVFFKIMMVHFVLYRFYSLPKSSDSSLGPTFPGPVYVFLIYIIS